MSNTFNVIRPSFIVKNNVSKDVSVFGLKIRPGKTANVIRSVPNLKESDIIHELTPPHGNLYLKIKDGEISIVSYNFITFNNPNIDSAIAKQSLFIDMLDVNDVTGGETTQTVGFTVKKSSGSSVTSPVLVDFGAYKDETLSNVSPSAMFSDASTGTIIYNLNSIVRVKTDSNGAFRCTLTNALDETLHLACSSTVGGPAIDCEDIEIITFSM